MHRSRIKAINTWGHYIYIYIYIHIDILYTYQWRTVDGHGSGVLFLRIVWQIQGYKPTIWEWFVQPIKKVILGCVELG